MKLTFPFEGTPRALLIRRTRNGPSLPNLSSYIRIKNFREVIDCLRILRDHNILKNFPIILENKISAARRAVKYKDKPINTIGKIHGLIYSMASKLKKVIEWRDGFLAYDSFEAKKMVEILENPNLSFETKKFYVETYEGIVCRYEDNDDEITSEFY